LVESSEHIIDTSSPFRVRELDKKWNHILLRTASIAPVEADRLSIWFDRSPDIFLIPKLTSNSYKCGGLFSDSELLGFAIATFQKRYLYGHLSEVMYLGNMHVTRAGRGKHFLYHMSDFFFKDLPPGVEYIYGYVVEKNPAAMDLVRRIGFRAKIMGQIAMANIFLLLPIKQSTKYSIRKATTADIDQIVSLLQEHYSGMFLAPEINHVNFIKNLNQRPNFDVGNYFLALSGSEVIGVCSAWDMTAFKKNRILRYDRSTAFRRQIYNLAAPLLGAAQLPAAGQPIKDITIAEYALKNRDPKIMDALLRHIYRHYRKAGYQSLIFGADINDPLLKATKHFLKSLVRSNVIMGSIQPEKVSQLKKPSLIYTDTIQI